MKFQSLFVRRREFDTKIGKFQGGMHFQKKKKSSSTMSQLILQNKKIMGFFNFVKTGAEMDNNIVTVYCYQFLQNQKVATSFNFVKMGKCTMPLLIFVKFK